LNCGLAIEIAATAAKPAFAGWERAGAGRLGGIGAV
jgi:hypothetical protein